MEPDESLHAVASRQVLAVLHRWDPAPDDAHGPQSLDRLVDPILAALTFEPSAGELAEELNDLVWSRLHVRASRLECLAAARDLLDGHSLLFESVIDAV